MKIQCISDIYNPFKYKSYNNNTQPLVANKANPAGDIVSFSAKQYNADSILNPTNHCAYCGCKVYNEQQIDSIAKEMLSSKAGRLEGDIKSVLEKLEGAKRSAEIETAKRMENHDEIEFFKNFLDISSKKSFLKGKSVFEQIYGVKDEKKAIELLTKNMHPLLKTIDHISPQNEGLDKKNSDINLVEACYCCNHDLKKGSSFGEFYTMFPSIKNNMPKEKFEYAFSKLLGSSSEIVSQRLSASNIISLLDRLFVQRTEAANYLDSINFRISSCKSGIDDAILSCKDEILSKETEISDLNEKFKEINDDPEYAAMLKRLNLTSQIDSIKDVISSQKKKKQRISNSINEIQNPKKSKEDGKEKPISNEEKAKKTAELKESLLITGKQISELEEKVHELELQLEDLNTEFPVIEMIQNKESKVKYIYNAHLSLKITRKEIEEEQKKIDNLSKKENNLKSQILDISEDDINFEIDKYSPKQQSLFERYKELNEALKFIEEHPNGNNIKLLINDIAKERITDEITELEKQQVIIDYNNYKRRENLKLQLNKVEEDLSSSQKTLENLEKQCRNYTTITQSMTENEAVSQIQTCHEIIARLTEKQKYIKIPQKIRTLKAEITLLNQTINDLEAKKARIH